MVLFSFDLFDQPPGTSCGVLRGTGFSSGPSRSLRVPLCAQYDRSVDLQKRGGGGGGGGSLHDSEHCSPVDPSPLQTPPDQTGSAYYSRQAQCVSGFSESLLPGPRLGADLVSSGLPGASMSMACDNRPLCDLDECLASGVLCSDGRSSVSGHERHDAVVGWHAGTCLPALRPSASCAVEGSAVQGSGAHPCGSVLVTAPLVSRLSGDSGGCPGVPSAAEGSTQTAALPSFHQNLHVLRLTAFRIASDQQEPSDSLRRWLVNLPAGGGVPPE